MKQANIIEEKRQQRLTEPEFAQAVGVSVSTLQKYRRERRIQFRKYGRNIFYLREDIDTFFALMLKNPAKVDPAKLAAIKASRAQEEAEKTAPAPEPATATLINEAIHPTACYTFQEAVRLTKTNAAMIAQAISTGNLVAFGTGEVRVILGENLLAWVRCGMRTGR